MRHVSKINRRVSMIRHVVVAYVTGGLLHPHFIPAPSLTLPCARHGELTPMYALGSREKIICCSRLPVISRHMDPDPVHHCTPQLRVSASTLVLRFYASSISRSGKRAKQSTHCLSRKGPKTYVPSASLLPVPRRC